MLAACVGSAVTGRECRVEVNRNVDMRMTGGRNATRVAYTAAFDECVGVLLCGCVAVWVCCCVGGEGMVSGCVAVWVVREWCVLGLHPRIRLTHASACTGSLYTVRVQACCRGSNICIATCMTTTIAHCSSSPSLSSSSNTRSGVVSAIKLRVDMLGSVFIDITYIDTNGLKNELDSCYAVPAWDVEIVLTKCNIHPLTAMRSPGHTQVRWLHSSFLPEGACCITCACLTCSAHTHQHREHTSPSTSCTRLPRPLAWMRRWYMRPTCWPRSTWSPMKQGSGCTRPLQWILWSLRRCTRHLTSGSFSRWVGIRQTPLGHVWSELQCKHGGGHEQSTRC